MIFKLRCRLASDRFAALAALLDGWLQSLGRLTQGSGQHASGRRRGSPSGVQSAITGTLWVIRSRGICLTTGILAESTSRICEPDGVHRLLELNIQNWRRPS